MSGIAKTPEPPYYAVIFASQRKDGDKGYGEMAERMVELASKQKGFLGIDSARDSNLGITVSYWQSAESIRNWKEHAAHKVAQERGKKEWYQNYTVRVCKVERDYNFEL
ncbi:antibiotic biosynthesis monooxygenase [Radiobacillus kanasensis]|uniref:antibiotic biosynthesis monooxygenase family protein n=1 Tax=Radiobacillus kanasensis TaxID=2844358 RepID=UPI001E5BF4B9|nr:antibiotic biosynthesis monooxygenase [Radiobacillus kanasensis]UFU00919.1 antibiotic biosynthesis monooxygenase [Radiobacillus kanasensis]